MQHLRTQFRGIIFGITGILVAFLVFRVGLDLISAPSNNILVSFINSISDILIAPVQGIITRPAKLPFLNTDAIVAMGVYIFGAIAFTEIVTGFMHDNIEDIIQNVLDGIFKFVEFLLILRIIFELFGVTAKPDSPQFVLTLYALTEWTQGILFRVPFAQGYVDLSAIICLIIVVVLDVVSESLIRSLFKQGKTIISTTKRSNVEVHPVHVQPVVVPVMQQPVQQAPQPQHITINMPQAQHVPIPVMVPQPIPQQPQQPQRITATVTHTTHTTKKEKKPLFKNPFKQA